MKCEPNSPVCLRSENNPQDYSFTRLDLIFLLIIASAALALVLPLFLRGFPWGDDIRHHYRWSFYFCEALHEGAVYPRWLAGANRGYGSPTMFYYPPLEFYVVAVFNLVVRNLLLAIELSCAFSMLLSGVTMYIFSRPVLSRAASLTAAVLYMSAPYHVLDLYRVNGLAEYWSFVWIPLVFDAARRIAAGQGWTASAYLALCYGLLLLTHVPSSFIMGLILPVYTVVLTRDKHKLAQTASGLALGAGCSAAFLVSVLFETKYVHIERLLGFTYADSFMFEDFSAFSLTNLLSAANYPRVTGYVTEANLVAAGFALLLTLVSIALWLNRRSLKSDFLSGPSIGALWLAAIVSLLMTTRLTEPVWAMLRLQYLQFPLRWLVAASAPTCLLSAIALSAAGEKRKVYVLCAVLLGAAIAFNVAISAHVATQAPADPRRLEGELAIQDVREYAPLWWDEQFHEEFQQATVIVDDGEADVRATDDAGSTQAYEVNARTEATLKFRSLYFPGWIARLDNNIVETRQSDAGNILLIVPPGEHHVTLRFEKSWEHIGAGIVSGVSVLTLAVMFYTKRRKPSRKSI